MSGSIAELEAYIEALADQIERKPSAALSKRLAARETQLEKTRADLKDWSSAPRTHRLNVVKHRAARLRDCLRRLKAHPDEIAAANSALRECVEHVTVDYSARAAGTEMAARRNLYAALFMAGEELAARLRRRAAAIIPLSRRVFSLCSS